MSKVDKKFLESLFECCAASACPDQTANKAPESINNTNITYDIWSVSDLYTRTKSRGQFKYTNVTTFV